MNWGAIIKAINDQIRTPLNHLNWIQDLIITGTDGYAGQSKNIKNQLCVCEEAVSHSKINDFLFQWALDNCLHIGRFFKNIYDMSNLNWDDYETLSDVLENTDTLHAVMNNSISAKLILENNSWRKLITDNVIYFMALAKSAPAVTELFKTDYVTLNLLKQDDERRKILLESPYAAKEIAKDTKVNGLYTIYRDNYKEIIENETMWAIAVELENVIRYYANELSISNLILNNNSARKILWNSDIGLRSAMSIYNFMNTYLPNSTQALKEFFFEYGIYEKVLALNYVSYIAPLIEKSYSAIHKLIYDDADFEMSESKQIRITGALDGTPQIVELPFLTKGKIYVFEEINISPGQSYETTGNYLKISEDSKLTIYSKTFSLYHTPHKGEMKLLAKNPTINTIYYEGKNPTSMIFEIDYKEVGIKDQNI